MASVFARLRVPASDGSGAVDDHGVHAFIVPLRDAEGNPAPGVEIRDCGYKASPSMIFSWSFRSENLENPLQIVQQAPHPVFVHLRASELWWRKWVSGQRPKPGRGRCCAQGQPAYKVCCALLAHTVTNKPDNSPEAGWKHVRHSSSRRCHHSFSSLQLHQSGHAPSLGCRAAQLSLQQAAAVSSLASCMCTAWHTPDLQPCRWACKAWTTAPCASLGPASHGRTCWTALAPWTVQGSTGASLHAHVG